MLRKAGVLALIPLLLRFAATTYEWGVADIYAAHAQSYIRTWRKSGKSPEDQEWNNIESILVTSLDKHPGFPPYLEVLGEFNLIRSLDFFLDDAEADEMRQTALKNFRKVVSRRPSWPYGWGDIALVKLANEESNGEEFFHAVERADSLGPWESKVQRVVGKAGLSVWEELDQEEKQIIIDNLKRGTHRQLGEIFKIVEYSGRKDVICSVAKFELIERFCRCR
jgi:hypothetical protein